MPSLAPGDLDTIGAEDLSYDYTLSHCTSGPQKISEFQDPGFLGITSVERERDQTPHEKTLNGGRFRGVSFIQTLFVIIVSETYLRLG